MRRMMNMVLFKGFSEWCVLYSLVSRRIIVLSNQYDLLRSAHLLSSIVEELAHCIVLFYLYIILSHFPFFMVNDQNQRKSELNSFRLCFSLSSYLYFLVTKKSLRLQVCVQRFKLMNVLVLFSYMCQFGERFCPINGWIFLCLPTHFFTGFRCSLWLPCSCWTSTAHIKFTWFSS